MTPQADLKIQKTESGTATPDATITYTVVVTNNGPSDVTAATVTDTMPSDISSDNWSRTTNGGATGSGSDTGTGSISDTVNMPSGSTITYSITATVSSSPAGSTLDNTAYVASTLDNDQSSTSTPIVISPVGYTTYSPGGYAGSGTPGKLLTSKFSTAYPSGMEIGYFTDNTGFGDKWLTGSSSKLKNFLNGAGTPAVLKSDVTDPTSAKNNGGTYATHLATLTLNVKFSGFAGTNMKSGFGSLHYVQPGDSLNGKTMQEILNAANTGISGNNRLPAGYDVQKMANLVANLNLSFDNGVKSTWAQTHLSL